MELLKQWGHSGFMEHVAKVEDFYRSRRDKMQEAAEKHLTGTLPTKQYGALWLANLKGRWFKYRRKYFFK